RVGQGVQLARLGDVPVLAELAAEVAARRAEREDRRTRQEMGERLLLDRIDAETARPAVGREHDLASLAGPDEAEPALAFVQLAEARAKITLHPAVNQPVPVLRRNSRFNQSRNTAHDAPSVILSSRV